MSFIRTQQADCQFPRVELKSKRWEHSPILLQDFPLHWLSALLRLYRQSLRTPRQIRRILPRSSSKSLSMSSVRAVRTPSSPWKKTLPIAGFKKHKRWWMTGKLRHLIQKRQTAPQKSSKPRAMNPNSEVSWTGEGLRHLLRSDSGSFFLQVNRSSL